MASDEWRAKTRNPRPPTPNSLSPDPFQHMDAFRIIGGNPLSGSVEVSGAKNAALPIMAASLLADGPVCLTHVPALTDVRTMALLLGRLGVECNRHEDGSLRLETVDASPTTADYHLVRRMRASFCVLGPLLARRGRAVVSLPGGCAIGDRPVDLHLAGLAALGATVRIERGYVVAEARRLVGARILLSGPRGPTVTGTANILSAAVLARGTTIITGAAREPEIVDLGQFLNSLGARINGLGTRTIEITGVDSLGGGQHRVIPDRIEAATLLVAAAASGGEATVTGVVPEHLTAVLAKLDDFGTEVSIEQDRVAVRAARRLRPVRVIAQAYPGIPTDVQSQFMALACLADGASVVDDLVFAERFHHVAELIRLGACIDRDGNRAFVRGVPSLSGAEVTAADLRASAALVVAGLAARGVTTLHRIDHLDRGYERLDAKLNRLGARIDRLRIARGRHTAKRACQEPLSVHTRTEE